MNRGEEIWNTFERLIGKIKTDPVDMLLIAGDLFHRQPLLRELKEVDYLFSTIPNTKVVLCAGNHDAIKRGSFYKNFQWSSNVIFLASETIEKVFIPELQVYIYGLSYYNNEIKDALYDNITVDKTGELHILLAHGGDEKHIPMNRRKLSMAGFDYIALGHIHVPDLDETNKMAYCGSLEPIDMGDTGERGYIYGELTKERLDIEFVPFAKRIYMDLEYTITPRMTNMEIRHKVSDLIAQKGKDHMYRIILGGYREPNLELKLSELQSVGNIVAIQDQTVPDFDFEALYEDHKDNILGMFIKSCLENDCPDELQKKSLYYGTKALLDAMEERQ